MEIGEITITAFLLGQTCPPHHETLSTVCVLPSLFHLNYTCAWLILMLQDDFDYCILKKIGEGSVVANSGICNSIRLVLSFCRGANVCLKCPVALKHIKTLILPRSRTGTVWFYTSTSNKRAARPKLYTKSLTRDLKRMYSRLTLARISINL